MKKTRLFVASLFMAAFSLSSLYGHAQIDSCCAKPDSLRVTNITDSSFCLKWKVKDSSNCDTPRAAIVQWRPVGTTTWKTKVVYYSAGQTTATYCDTGTACITYQWRVRSACLANNGDTTFSQYVSGPNFKLLCPGPKQAKSEIVQPVNSSQLQLTATPNPVHSIASVSGMYSGTKRITVTILSNKGYMMYSKPVTVSGGKFNLMVDVSKFETGMYFINASDGSNSARVMVMKE